MFKVYVGKIKRTDSCTFFQVGKQNVVLDLVIDIMGGFVSAFLYFGYNGVQWFNFGETGDYNLMWATLTN